MVKGLDRFKEHFAEYSDRYVLIGGTASSMSIEEVGGEFRGTKDLDLVLCVEAFDPEFAEVFWNFIRLGKYETRQKSTGKRLFYRFHTPQVEGYPEMLELFARVPDALDLKGDTGITPIPVDEEISSLSAILMNDVYYDFVMERRVMLDGVSLVKADGLIPLKARAYVDLTQRKAAGEPVDSKNIRKHKNDIFRLFTVLERDARISIADSLKQDLAAAFTLMKQEPPDLKSLGITRMTFAEVLDGLSQIYNLSENPDQTS
jgi:hypothetical protein